MNEVAFRNPVELSSLIQYLHIPNHRKNIESVPSTPSTPNRSCSQEGSFAPSKCPKKIGNFPTTKIVEKRKSLTAWLDTSHSSLNQKGLNGPASLGHMAQSFPG